MGDATPLPGQESCEPCGRILNPRWAFCPSCGAAQDDAEAVTDGGEDVGKGTPHERIPDECQLCRLLDYRGDAINAPEGIDEVARDDGGTKLIHCCERCARELFGARSEFMSYEEDSDE